LFFVISILNGVGRCLPNEEKTDRKKSTKYRLIVNRALTRLLDLDLK